MRRWPVRYTVRDTRLQRTRREVFRQEGRIPAEGNMQANCR